MAVAEAEPQGSQIKYVSAKAIVEIIMVNKAVRVKVTLAFFIVVLSFVFEYFYIS